MDILSETMNEGNLFAKVVKATKSGDDGDGEDHVVMLTEETTIQAVSMYQKPSTDQKVQQAAQQEECELFNEETKET
ncbi:unnamed protein product [Ambrosiozyma monospora]|uniref:Unnamed protein product n=1 Tax=Ambrosiozyma monospora TaxID=43982 RepID=A0ACB5TSY4_AMBMO|nr:unnamed protein product [Ambrosiozyma monospora]